MPTQAYRNLTKYLSGLERNGAIQGFDVVLLDPHGGDLSGFFLIKGESSQLDKVVSTSEWITHVTRASLHLEGSGAVRGVTGDEVMKRMAIWTNAIPS